MKHFGALLIFCTLIVLNSYGQEQIKGRVIDKENNQPLKNVNVIIEKSNKGTSTKNDGTFNISGLETGLNKLKFSHIGYKDSSIVVILPLREDIILTIALNKKVKEVKDVVVTASRKIQAIEEVPGRIDIIGKNALNIFASTNLDDMLRAVSNVNVNRSWGIFSRNSAVNMRGIDGSARVLILLDGVPLNKSAGGSINWHLIRPETVEKIEVAKGPASSVYGNNAMTGVINLITKRPRKPLSGEAGLFYGSFNTYGGNITIGGDLSQGKQGFYWQLNGFYREGDGYNLYPEDQRDSTTIDAFLEEKNASAMIGYRFNDKHRIEADYNFHKDRRSEGVRVYTDDGTFNKIHTDYFRLKYTGDFNKVNVSANAFYHIENLIDQDEKVNNSGIYKFSAKDQKTTDKGLWVSSSVDFSENHNFVTGFDIKHGYFSAIDAYKSSTDLIDRQGESLFFALFVHDEIRLLDKHLTLLTALRVDFSNFYNGNILVETPTSATGFKSPFEDDYDKESWTAFSPKMALKYKFSDVFRAYTSYSVGFMPPKLDDMCSSRAIRKGFKIANPKLKPEYLTNYEIGVDFKPLNNISITSSIYYSIGKNFQYLLNTGEYITSPGDDIPIMQKDNITEVAVKGFEVNLNWHITDNFNFKTNYNYNDSEITAFENEKSDTDLTGKKLMEVPKNQFYNALDYSYKNISASLIYAYTGEQWFDDENTILVDSYDSFDIKVSYMAFRHLLLSLTIQNTFDNEFIDKKGLLAPGRFVLGEIKYRF